MTKIAFNDLSKVMLGFDRLDTDRLLWGPGELSQQYPRYNIVKEDGGYRVEVAVPGRSKNTVSVTVEKQSLIVKGEALNGTDVSKYLHKGISGKGFSKTFHVGENLKVESATLTDGLLKIWIAEHVPEEDKPKSITID